MTPLRQFKGVPAEVVRKAEGKQFVSFSSTITSCSALTWPFFQPWYRYFDLVSTPSL
jgi:hypothetical protein